MTKFHTCSARALALAAKENVMKHALWLIAGALLVGGCAQTTPELQVVDQAANAIGGRDRILAVNTLILEGEGENYNLGQNRSPDAELPRYKVTSFRRAIDFANGRARQEQTRTPEFLTGNPAPQKQVGGIDGDVAFNVGGDGSATRAPETAGRDRKAELRHHPIGILRAALQPGTQLQDARTYEGHDVVAITTADGARFTLSIDSTTKLPASVTSMTYHPNLGDVAMETQFADYTDADGLKVPQVITSRLDKYTLATIRVSRSGVNADAGDLQAPAAAKTASAAPPAPTVTVEEVAPRIWFLAGQSHHSVLVEFADHLTLIEAPQSEARTLAVIAKAKELRPNKPLTEVVTTHHHFDHSAGVRAAVSQGLTVIAHGQTRPFYEDIVARKHTIVPDALAQNAKPLAIQTVDDQKVLKDASMTVELYPITGSPHGDTLLMAYFPRERLLVEADVYSPPAPNATAPPAFPFAANLVDNIRKRNLRVDRVVPIHGRIVPFSELLKAADWKPVTN
jgi:glyoxylase-like metal-dependent hydrolase (beta-lactamase superfamily II)